MNKDTLEHLAIGRRLLAELNEALAALDQGATVDDVTTMTSKRPGCRPCGSSRLAVCWSWS